MKSIPKKAKIHSSTDITRCRRRKETDIRAKKKHIAKPNTHDLKNPNYADLQLESNKKSGQNINYF